MIDYWNMDEYVFKLAHLKATNLFFVTNFSRTMNVYPYLQIVSFLTASCHVFLIDYSKNFEQIYRIQFTCVIDVLLHCQYTYIKYWQYYYKSIINRVSSRKYCGGLKLSYY